MATFPPQAYLIGAQKSGTTFLASLLNQSPQICVSKPKEPQFLSVNFDRGLDYYADLFTRKDAKVFLDASTTYTFLRPKRHLHIKGAPGLLAPVPQRMKDLRPDARLIYILRDPVDRVISGYLHRLRHEPGRRGRGRVSLVDCLREDPMLDLISRYSDQIERYRDCFSMDDFLFVDFADLRRDPLGTAARCCAFLGVDFGTAGLEEAAALKHSAHALTGLGRLTHRLQKRAPQVSGTLRRLFPGSIKNRLKAALRRSGPQIEFLDRDAVGALFAEEKERIRELTGIAF